MVREGRQHGDVGTVSMGDPVWSVNIMTLILLLGVSYAIYYIIRMD